MDIGTGRQEKEFFTIFKHMGVGFIFVRVWDLPKYGIYQNMEFCLGMAFVQIWNLPEYVFCPYMGFTGR